ncbi:MAG: flagellar hook-basal body protein [Fimbriimonadaceae bacterium]|nr:flagellar hook-basal body protein [Fimbriimonadaceae bacterium]
MNRGIYATAAGMSAAQSQLDVLTHNLANASTHGFKQDALAFADNYAVQLKAGGAPIGSMGYGPSLQSQYTDFSVGSIEPTGNPLDVAIPNPRGFFAVQTPDGVRYTRDGAFTLTDGTLTTQNGFPVLDDRGTPILVPDGEIAVSSTGEIAVNGIPAGTLGVYEGTFAHEGHNLYTAPDALPMDAPEVRSGALESSNVNPVTSMVSMVEIHRIFELSQRTITQQDELTQRLIQSLQDR